MSSGKAGINYSIKVLDNTSEISIPVLPVLEKNYEFKLNESCVDHKLTKCYGKIVNVHSFLLNNEELTNTQKLDYCSMERYFMKAYLKEMMKKV
ncbi:MAG: hypothetical protein ACTSQL_11420 [Promethearchaeota archaeon]